MRVCQGGHPMAAVPVCGGSVRSVCLVCLSGCAVGTARLKRGSEMNVYRLLELVNSLEASESGGEFAALDVAAVPGFDKLFNACDVSGVPFSSDGLRKLARRIAGRIGKPVAAVMGMQPAAVADCVGRFGLRPERVPA